MFSMDGAKLYRNKDSDCTIAIWVILSLSPTIRYKKAFIFPAFFIPGPRHPRNHDSYMYPSFHHLSALQNEGLTVWDAFKNKIYKDYPFLGFATADAVGMASLSGGVGHLGKFGCRLRCTQQGRRKPGDKSYFPTYLKPNNYSVPGCDHADSSYRERKGTSAELAER